MLISIIIPCYNVENYIEECINSCYAQSYLNIEVIAVDNNSGDNTFARLKELQQNYPKLIITKELKPGAPAARNKGLHIAKGEWIQFLDADDLLMPTKIEHQLHFINKENGFISGACIKRNIDEVEIEIQPLQEDIYKALFTTQLGNTCSNLWRKNSIKAIGGWNESLKSSQEADLMFRLIKNNKKVVFDQKPLTIIRARPEGQISQRGSIVNWKQYLLQRLEMLNWIKQNHYNYYLKNRMFYENSLLGIIKMIERKDINEAASLHTIYLRKNYKTLPISFYFKKPYFFFLYVFGYKISSKIIILVFKNKRVT